METGGARRPRRVVWAVAAALAVAFPASLPGVASDTSDPPTPKARLVPSGSDTHLGWFGRSVAVGDGRLVVGAPSAQLAGSATLTGAAFVFTADGAGGWTAAKLVASDAADGDSFGASVAASGGRVVVGAPQGNLGTTGRVYVYEPDGAGGWTETKITASDIADLDLFGFSVAASGDTIVVGSPDDDDKGTRSGSVYVYAPNGAGGWSETKITAADGAPNDRFGWSVAVRDDWIAVGAVMGVAGSDPGKAYLLRPDGAGGWSQTVFTQPDPDPRAEFGRSVAVEPGLLVVSADRTREAAGAGWTHVFVEDGQGAWGHDVIHTPASDQVAVRGGTVVVGASENDGGGNQRGSVTVLREFGGEWTQTRLLAADGQDHDRFGSAVAMDEHSVFVGAPLASSGTSRPGAAYLFDQRYWGQAPPGPADPAVDEVQDDAGTGGDASDDPARPTPLPRGTNLDFSGRLLPGIDRLDAYGTRIDAGETDELTFDVKAPPFLDIVLRLLRPDGTVAAVSDRGGPGALETVTVTAAGPLQSLRAGEWVLVVELADVPSVDGADTGSSDRNADEYDGSRRCEPRCS